MSETSFANAVVGIVRDMKKVRYVAARKEHIAEALNRTGYFNAVAVDMFVNALEVLEKTADTKRKT